MIYFMSEEEYCADICNRSDCTYCPLADARPETGLEPIDDDCVIDDFPIDDIPF